MPTCTNGLQACTSFCSCIEIFNLLTAYRIPSNTQQKACTVLKLSISSKFLLAPYLSLHILGQHSHKFQQPW